MQLSAKWVALFALVWLIGMWLGTTYDGYSSFDTFVGADGSTANNSATLSGLESGSETTQQLPLVGNIPFVTPTVNFITSVFKIITWQFSFVEPYPMIQAIFTAFGTMGFLTMLMIVYGMVTGNLTWG